MKFWEAMKAMEEGAQVRAVKWGIATDYLYLNEGKIRRSHSHDSTTWESLINVQDWQIYKELKKVELHEGLYTFPDGDIELRWLNKDFSFTGMSKIKWTGKTRTVEVLNEN